MPLVEGEIRCVEEAINFVCLQYNIHLFSPVYDDIKQELWKDVLKRGLVQRYNHNKSQLKTWIIFCLMQTFQKVTTKWSKIYDREEVGIENRGLEYRGVYV